MLIGLHQTIDLSFMLVGHTKFSPDWCFGLLKQRYKRTDISSLQDIVNVVNASANVNVAQLVGTQKGKEVVTTYDWAAFLGEHLRKVPRMKVYHHFTFLSTMPGAVVLKESTDSSPTTFQRAVDGWSPSASELPSQIVPSWPLRRVMPLPPHTDPQVL